MSNPYDTLNQPDPVDSTKWEDMDAVQLQDQLDILNRRLTALEAMGTFTNPQSIQSLRFALNHSISVVDQLIQSKTLQL